jgi:hypothetical protein
MLRAPLIRPAAKDHQKRLLRDDDEDHEDRRPEGRKTGRETLDHQAPDQDHHGQEVV